MAKARTNASARPGPPYPSLRRLRVASRSLLLVFCTHVGSHFYRLSFVTFTHWPTVFGSGAEMWTVVQVDAPYIFRSRLEVFPSKQHFRRRIPSLPQRPRRMCQTKRKGAPIPYHISPGSNSRKFLGTSTKRQRDSNFHSRLLSIGPGFTQVIRSVGQKRSCFQ